MKVSIGRIVLIVNRTQGEHITRPAIVVTVSDNDYQAIDVHVFGEAPVTFLYDVRHESAVHVDLVQDVFWIWPPRES